MALLPTTNCLGGAFPRQWDTGVLGAAPGYPAANGVSPYSTVPRGPGECSAEHCTWCLRTGDLLHALATGLAKAAFGLSWRRDGWTRTILWVLPYGHAQNLTKGGQPAADTRHTESDRQPPQGAHPG